MSHRILADRERDGDAVWLAARRPIVTASESAHLMGAVKGAWGMSAEQLAERKLGGSEFQPSALMLAGQFWERPILDYFTEVTGITAQPTSTLYGSIERPWMGATPDALLLGLKGLQEGLEKWLVVQYRFELLRGSEAILALRELCSKGEGLLEVKNQQSKDRSRWNKEAGGPAYYENQVQHQLCVLERSLGLLVAKVDANELYCHVIEADELYHELLSETCKSFVEKYLGTT